MKNPIRPVPHCLLFTLVTLLSIISCSRQSAEPTPVITANRTEIQIGLAGGKDSIIINSSVAWTIGTLPTWIHTNINSADAGNSKLVFTVDANAETTARTGEIKVNATGTPTTVVKVVQSGLSLTTFSPQRGPAHTSVKLTGTFGTQPIIMLNDMECTITSKTENEIVFLVPSEASSGKIKVSFDNTSLTYANDFTVTNTWIRVSESHLRGELQTGVSFVWENKIYFGLGSFYSEPTPNSDFWIFEPSTGQWSKGPSLPTEMPGRQSASSVFMNGTAYMGFGHWGSHFRDVWAFTPSTGEWKMYPYPFSTGSITPVFMGLDNNLFVGQPVVDKGIIKKFDPQLNNGNGDWITVTSSFPQLQSASPVTIGNYAYFTGGTNPDSSLFGLRSTYRFDATTNSVNNRADNLSLMGISNAPFVSLNGKAYMLHMHHFYQYDPAADKWEEIASENTPDTNKMGMYQMAVLNNEIYAWYYDGSMYKYVPL